MGWAVEVADLVADVENDLVTGGDDLFALGGFVVCGGLGGLVLAAKSEPRPVVIAS